MTDIPPTDASKSEWRDWARAARSEVDFVATSQSVVTGLLDWPPLTAARKTLIYLPLGDEVDLRPLIDAGLATSFYATRTPDQGGALAVHELGGPLEVHRFGMLQPHGAAAEVAASSLDVLLVPGLAFDLWGTRLGRGAGYFDRMLGGTGARASIAGVTPAMLVVDRLPRESRDVPMRYLATEEGVLGVAG